MRNPVPPQQVAQPAVNVTGRARAKQPVSNNKATVNGTTGLSKAAKRRLRTQRMMMNGGKAPKKQLPVVSKQTPTTKAKSVQSTPSLSAETPIQTPMQAPVQIQSRSHVPTTNLIELDAGTIAKQEPKLSKAQKRKLRKQKKTKNGVVTQQAPSICSSVGPTKPPIRNNPIPVNQSRPMKPPMSNSKSKSKAKPVAAGNVQSEPKLSKAQKRKMRKNKLKNAA